MTVLVWLAGSIEGNRLTPFDFEELNRSANGRLAVVEGTPMTRNDFRIAMLLRLGRVEHADFAVVDKVFASLDTNRSGTISQREVVGDHADAMEKRMELLAERWEEAKGGAGEVGAAEPGEGEGVDGDE